MQTELLRGVITVKTMSQERSIFQRRVKGLVEVHWCKVENLFKWLRKLSGAVNVNKKHTIISLAKLRYCKKKVVGYRATGEKWIWPNGSSILDIFYWLLVLLSREIVLLNNYIHVTPAQRGVVMLNAKASFSFNSYCNWIVQKLFVGLLLHLKADKAPL